MTDDQLIDRLQAVADDTTASEHDKLFADTLTVIMLRLRMCWRNDSWAASQIFNMATTINFTPAPIPESDTSGGLHPPLRPNA